MQMKRVDGDIVAVHLSPRGCQDVWGASQGSGSRSFTGAEMPRGQAEQLLYRLTSSLDRRTAYEAAHAMPVRPHLSVLSCDGREQYLESLGFKTVIPEIPKQSTFVLFHCSVIVDWNESCHH